MKVPLSWLEDFVDIEISPQVLAEKLTNIGFEIEDLQYLGKDIEKVITGKITEIIQHPNADKLVVCKLDMGYEILTIVTGAKNINIGDIVPVATDGSILPCGKTIKSSPLRGVMSQGMLCSGEELCIDNSVINGAEIDGILILPSDTKLGMDIKTILGLDDYIFDISITPNRPDCNSIWGMAREVGAVLGKKITPPSFEYKSNTSEDNGINVNIQDFGLCSRYTASRITDAKILPSPKWMQDRLRKVGIRAINNFADITNYVLVEIGQPMHAFNYRCIEGAVINVRPAKKDEKITALDGKVYTLNDKNLIIADKNKPLAIAGIMGGEYTSISSDTKEIVFESAVFARGDVRITSRALGLSSASSSRFSKGVDYLSCELGQKRALALVSQLKCGKIIGDIKDIKQTTIKEKEIKVSVKKINELLGLELSAQKMIDILTPLEIICSLKGDALSCIVPIFREDLEGHVDIAEEIIRYYGYDKIGATLPNTSQSIKIGVNKFYKAVNKTKQTLTGLGLYESLTYSFINKKSLEMLNLQEDDYRRNTIELINPLSEEYAVMRTTLIPNMLTVAGHNLNHKNNEFKIFEISRIYLPKNLPLNELPKESNMLGAVFCGEKENFFTVKAVIEKVLEDFGVQAKLVASKETFLHPGISADLMVGKEKIGNFGAVHPSVLKNFDIDKTLYVVEIEYDKLWNLDKLITFQPLPKYQAIERDLAFLIKEEISAQELTDYISRSGGSHLESVELFDVYTGSQIEEGYKSMAFSLVFRSEETTLKDDDVTKVIEKIIRGLTYKYNANLRS